MRPIAVALLSALLLGGSGGCAAAPASTVETAAAAETVGGTVEVRNLSSGTYGASEQRGAVAAFDEQTYRARWAELVGEGQPPAVDFSREAVVFVSAGQRSTGGYKVQVRGARVEGETLLLDVVVQGPPAGSMTSQALTNPYAVVAVSGAAFRDVRWAP
jgi:outer membrane protein assembly factor BamB